VFLVGILPALITLWIRKAVPEPEAWQKAHETGAKPGLAALFGPQIRRTTWITLTICALGLTAHWALMFWHTNHLRAIAEAAAWTKEARDKLAQNALFLLMVGSIIGNFAAGALAWRIGYRRAIALCFEAYVGMMMLAYATPRPPEAVLWMLPFIGACQGVFGLFTMCLPPLFPTLLRTTGAGFCYNFGRIASAAGVVLFGILPQIGKTAPFDQRLALFYSAWLFVPAALVSWLLLPEPEHDAV
jgi:predicted MFS family arabinose efflux permease